MIAIVCNCFVTTVSLGYKYRKRRLQPKSETALMKGGVVPPESNRGHKDFQSFALPTELWHHFLLRLQRYNKFLN